MADDQKGQKASMRRLAPIVVLLLLSVPLGVALVSGFPIGAEFKSSTLVKFVSGNLNLNADNVERTVEGVINQNVTVDQKSNLFEVEVLSAVDNSLINTLKSRLTALGMWDNTHTFTVEALGPVLSAAQLQSGMAIVVGVLILLALLALILYRRRAVAFSIPLVVGINVTEVLGVMVLLNIPLGLSALVGITAIAIYSIDANVFLTSRMLRDKSGWSKEQVRRAIGTGTSMGTATLALFFLLGALTMSSQVISLAVVFLSGVGLNLFNTWFIGAEILARWGKKPLEVSYHVSL